MALRFLVLASALARARGAADEPRAAHDAVVADPTSAAACGRRLRALRALVVAGDHGGALDLSFDLEALRAARPDLHADCRADAPFVGAADVVVEVRTPRARGGSSAAPRVTAEAVLRHADGRVTKHALAGPAPRRSLRDSRAVGAVVDDLFVRAPDAYARRAARRPVVSRVDDKFTAHAIGEKTLLVTLLCPATIDGDKPNDCAAAYDYDVIAAEPHGGDVFSYLDLVVANANAFWEVNSWGNFSVVATYTPILEVAYAQNSCDDHDELDWYGGGYDADPDAFDVLAAHASLAAGYDREAYDMNVVIIPDCPASPLAGSGYTGSFGAFINLAANDNDPSFVHELGHNFGANHASYVSNDVTNPGGTTARYDDDDLWIEYGNLFTPMGAGSVYAGMYSTHFTVEGKAVFDWLPRSSLRRVDPYDADGGALCDPCAFTIYATDTGALEVGSPVGLQIATATDDFFLFVEFRSETPYGTRGALLTWSGFSYNAAQTGTYGNSLMVDGSPETGDLRDAIFQDGTDVLLDVGTADDPRPLSAYFKIEGDGVHLDVELYSSATMKPTVSVAPTTAAPTLSPTEEGDKCGKDKYCCAHVDVDGYARFNKIRDARGLGGSEHCCSSRCSFLNDDGYYLHYISQGGQYYITTSEPCYTSGALSYAGTVSDDEVQAYCEAIEPTPRPTLTVAPTLPHVCVEDDADWYVKKKPANDCAYIAKKLDRCDEKEGEDGRLARVACDATCFECEPGSGAPTAAPTPCVDDAAWVDTDGNDCAAVGLRPLTRCYGVDAGGVGAAEACPRACYVCRDADCYDSTSWTRKKAPSKDCAWVSKSATTRCVDVDDAGVAAYLGCQDSCDTCTLVASCADSTSWYAGAADQDCAWAAKKASARCASVDGAGVDGDAACQLGCGSCFAQWNTAAPTPAPAAAAGDPTRAPTATCADSTSWVDAEKGRDCGQVGKKPFERCQNVDAAGVSGLDGCPRACYQCYQPGCDDDPSWFGKAPSKDCAFVAEKTETRCMLWDDVTETYAYWGCPDTCGTCALADACEDSTSWYAGSKPQDSCAGWVADDVEKRCGKSSLDGVKGESACPQTCGTCESPWGTAAPSAARSAPPSSAPYCMTYREATADECPEDADIAHCGTAGLEIGDLCEADGECGTEDINNCEHGGEQKADVYVVVGDPACADSTSFQLGSHETCDDVLHDPMALCLEADGAGVQALDACPYACFVCGHETDSCEDDAEWNDGNPAHDCAFVAEHPETRCLATGTDGWAAYLGCANACGTCAAADACTDSTSWLRTPARADKSDEDCAWVADKPETRCEKVSTVDGVSASVACSAHCGTCASLWYTAAPTPGPECKDSKTWTWAEAGDDSPFDCKYVAERPSTRCDFVGADGSSAALSCPAACDTCDAGLTAAPSAEDCADSASWFLDDKPSKDCAWIEADSRQGACIKTDAAGVRGWDACQEACHSCGDSRPPTQSPTRGCEDSTSWFYKKADKDCAWLADEKNQEKCAKTDDARVLGEFACPAACGKCTARPTPAPTTAAPSNACHDSLSWYRKKKSWNCAYAARKPEDRCEKTDEGGVAADVACPAACDACPTEPPTITCENDANFFYKKTKNDCGWIASNPDKCDKANQDGDTANAKCPMACGLC